MQANEREQTQSSFPAVHCKDGCSALQERLQCTAGKGHIMADRDLSSGVLPSRQHLWYAIYTEGVAPGYSE